MPYRIQFSLKKLVKGSGDARVYSKFIIGLQAGVEPKKKKFFILAFTG
jgi:hypothetical protein